MTVIALCARWVGLGLLAGAVLQSEAGAQDTTRVRRDTTVRVPIPPQADTIVKRDSIAQRDSAVRARLARLAADSLKTPLGRAEMPSIVDVARPALQWRRDSLFATGALSLLDLLERIPGLTALRAGWLATPLVGAYLGGITRVRVFYDGLEIDPLDPRMGGALDLASIPMWTAEEVRIERGADELRIHVRTWRIQRTTPYTRADVGTGDQETNLYRGFFGRRFARGEALQVAAQQLSTTPARFGGGSSEATVFARLGLADGWWKFDATLVRATLDRDLIVTATRVDSITPVTATHLYAYARATYGDPDDGPWAQLIVGGVQYDFDGVPDASTDGGSQAAPDADTTRYQAQYTLSGGLTWRGLRLSVTERYRSLEGRRYHSPAARASVESRLVSASALVETRGEDNALHASAFARLLPVSFIALGGAVATGRHVGRTSVDGRLEAAVRVGTVWLGGGVMERSATTIAPPVVFSRSYVPVSEARARGVFANVRGRILGPLHADLLGTRWQFQDNVLRPQYQTRSELLVLTTLPRRFPSGNFGLLASLRHEYRSHTLFATATGAQRAGGYRVLSGLVEVRILQAVLSYQYRNILVQDYVSVPGYPMPRQTQFYGVRWEFWN